MFYLLVLYLLLYSLSKRKKRKGTFSFCHFWRLARKKSFLWYRTESSSPVPIAVAHGLVELVCSATRAVTDYVVRPEPGPWSLRSHSPCFCRETPGTAVPEGWLPSATSASVQSSGVWLASEKAASGINTAFNTRLVQKFITLSHVRLFCSCMVVKVAVP